MTLPEKLRQEINRIENEVMPAYEDIGKAGHFALTMMDIELKQAKQALLEMDAVAMLKMYTVLKDMHT